MSGLQEASGEQRAAVALVLASASPRRAELLASVALEFEVRPADIDESREDGESAKEYVRRMAREKADRVAAEPGCESDVVLAADTVVCLGEEVFGKPANVGEALDMWRVLSGRTHDVYTALALSYNARVSEEMSISRVTFETISDQQMHAYWATGEPVDKAGGYAVQGLGSAWIRRIEGSYSGIVGLPLYELNRLLGSVGSNWL